MISPCFICGNSVVQNTIDGVHIQMPIIPLLITFFKLWVIIPTKIVLKRSQKLFFIFQVKLDREPFSIKHLRVYPLFIKNTNQ